MRIIISPAKKMRVRTDIFACRNLPGFLEEAQFLLAELRDLSYEEAKILWNCSDSIASLNYDRLMQMNLREGLTPAVLSYEGIQYQYMAPDVFTADAYEYIEEHLRILSGFYGVLRPFDGVQPYRLEMQARFRREHVDSLYDFWGKKPAEQIFSETDLVLNLASKEYSRCVEPYTPAGKQFVTCVFGQIEKGKVREKGTLCKMARGEMVRFLAESGAEGLEEVKAFCGLGYRWHEELSSDSRLVFIQEFSDGE